MTELTGDPAANAVFIDTLCDGLLPKAADALEDTGGVFELALDVLADQVFSAWSDRLTREVAGVVAALCLRVIEARQAYRLATGAVYVSPNGIRAD